MDARVKVDFHCHTIFSIDSLNLIEKVIQKARQRGLDKLVITDHNSIRGALEAKIIDPDLIIVGEEIKTTGGEILAAFVTEEVPRGLHPMDAIERLKNQGSFISLSHPFDSNNRTPWPEKDLIEVLPFIDALEGFNARNMDLHANARALSFAHLHGIPITVGSDAHIPFEVGRVGLFLPPFDSPEELRSVIMMGQPQARLSPFWVHFVSSFARLYKIFSGYTPKISV